MDSNTANTDNVTLPEPEIQTTAEKTTTNSKSKILFRWKGKIVKESYYRHRMALTEAAKKRKKSVDPEEFKIPVEGRRIVDIALLAKHLQCTACKVTLSLRDIKSETRRGLASVFHVKCRGCDIINFVPTSSRNIEKDNSKLKLYNVNSEFVNGALQSDISRNRLNKLLTCLSIPQVQWQLFDRHKPETQQTADLPASEELPEYNIGTDDPQNSEDVQNCVLSEDAQNCAFSEDAQNCALSEDAQNSETLEDMLPDSM